MLRLGLVACAAVTSTFVVWGCASAQHEKKRSAAAPAEAESGDATVAEGAPAAETARRFRVTLGGGDVDGEPSPPAGGAPWVELSSTPATSTIVDGLSLSYDALAGADGRVDLARLREVEQVRPQEWAQAAAARTSPPTSTATSTDERTLQLQSDVVQLPSGRTFVVVVFALPSSTVAPDRVVLDAEQLLTPEEQSHLQTPVSTSWAALPTTTSPRQVLVVSPTAPSYVVAQWTQQMQRHPSTQFSFAVGHLEVDAQLGPLREATLRGRGTTTPLPQALTAWPTLPLSTWSHASVVLQFKDGAVRRVRWLLDVGGREALIAHLRGGRPYAVVAEVQLDDVDGGIGGVSVSAHDDVLGRSSTWTAPLSPLSSTPGASTAAVLGAALAAEQLKGRPTTSGDVDVVLASSQDETIAALWRALLEAS